MNIKQLGIFIVLPFLTSCRGATTKVVKPPLVHPINQLLHYRLLAKKAMVLFWVEVVITFQD